MSHQFHPLVVKDIVRETKEAVTIYFTVPDDLRKSFSFKAGQYVTLKLILGGEEVRRAYSICVSPHEVHLAVNVKRVEKGRVSNYINDSIKQGDIIDVMEPDGKFTIPVNTNKRRDFYFFAAGSGITPVMSIIKTLLEEEPMSCCYLCYGNKDEESIIFKDELAKLEQKYDNQLFIRHTLSRPKREKEKGLKGLFSRGKTTWEGWQGRIDSAMVDKFLTENPARGEESHYFVCGPGAMIDSMVHHLESKGMGSDILHSEYFISSEPSVGSISAGGATSKVKVHLAGKEINVEVPPEKTILDVLIEHKYDPPYSCTSGACSTCIAKLIDGKVEMDACYALDDSEVAAGYILVCQSHPRTPRVELKFES